MFPCSVVVLLLPVLMVSLEVNGNDIFTRKCESRCLAQEDSSTSTCTSATCLLCIKPCGHKIAALEDCGSFCRKYTKKGSICRKSCKFMKKLYKNAHKLGKCPALVVPRVCGASCGTDNDCPGKQKCCISSQCDNKICHTPILEQPAANRQQMRQRNLTMIPPRARGFTIADQKVVNKAAELQLAWKPPHKAAGFQVHRYKLFWSKRLDYSNPIQKFSSLRVYQDSVLPSIHSYTLQGLACDTAYMLELQVVYQHSRSRVRSERVFLAVRTPSSKGVTKKKKPPHKGNTRHNNRWWKKRKPSLTEPVTTKMPQTTARGPTQAGLNVVDLAAKQSRAVQATKSLSGLILLAPVLAMLLFTR